MSTLASSFRRQIKEYIPDTTPIVGQFSQGPSVAAVEGQAYSDDPEDSVVFTGGGGDVNIRVEPSALEAWQERLATTLEMADLITEAAGWSHSFGPLSLVYTGQEFRYFELAQGKH